ncbi:hypothetical protein OVA26_16475 [Microbacterium sp. SL62]|uniref:hypothetical protein n=1 Tax=Microbacterium sp. SL62 TaxID=2995139 RepID=UPI00227304D0|nr:hypothetical protein [Microbacterium sp. SL62]MCY1718533.1 hypothetical protein [Microbacterium sp. SL62]
MTETIPIHQHAHSDVPAGFWRQIAHQLDRIRRSEGCSFDAVRDVLQDERYAEVIAEITRNGPTHQGDDATFFAGSGGDASLLEALLEAGWEMRAYSATCHYALRSPDGETLTYCEGDVLRGDHITD